MTLLNYLPEVNCVETDKNGIVEIKRSSQRNPYLTLNLIQNIRVSYMILNLPQHDLVKAVQEIKMKFI